MSDVAVIYAPDILEHNPAGYDPERPEWTKIVREILGEEDEGGMEFTHPERPQRVIRVLEALAIKPVLGLDWFDAEAAHREDLLLAHTEEHVDHIESYRGRNAWLDVDTTAVSKLSVHAAEVAVASAMMAVDQVVTGGYRRSMAIVRPPGHHAYAQRASGFCLYNNVAVAAAHARARHGVGRVLIVDFDAHHGNGTEAIFAADPDVALFDIHVEAPCYPGTGALEDVGEGEGAGTNLNVPLPSGSGDRAMLASVEEILAPAARRLKPELILVSAGYDGHTNDLLMSVTEQGYAAVTAALCELADDLCEGRIAFSLEGGYRDALGRSVRETLAVLAGGEVPEIDREADDPGLDAVSDAAAFHRKQKPRS